MDCYYDGSIKFTRELTSEEEKELNNLFIDAFLYERGLYIHGDKIEFNSYSAGYIGFELDEIVQLVHSWKDIQIVPDSTEFTYTGDCDAGYIYTEEKGFIDLALDKYFIKTALDGRLIDELVSRGYAVEKKDPSTEKEGSHEDHL